MGWFVGGWDRRLYCGWNVGWCREEPEWLGMEDSGVDLPFLVPLSWLPYQLKFEPGLRGVELFG